MRTGGPGDPCHGTRKCSRVMFSYQLISVQGPEVKALPGRGGSGRDSGKGLSLYYRGTLPVTEPVSTELGWSPVSRTRTTGPPGSDGQGRTHLHPHWVHRSLRPPVPGQDLYCKVRHRALSTPTPHLHFHLSNTSQSPERGLRVTTVLVGVEEDGTPVPYRGLPILIRGSEGGVLSRRT